MLSTNRKGAIAEAAIARRALELGVDVLRPIGDGGRYDLLFDVGDRLLRVQCKWAVREGPIVHIRCRRSRRARQGHLHRGYHAHEVDGVAAFCAEIDRCFDIPIDVVAGRRSISLRLEQTRNNQGRFVNWADDFAFESLQSASDLGP